MKNIIFSCNINKIIPFIINFLLIFSANAQEYMWIDISKKTMMDDNYNNYGCKSASLSGAYVFGGKFESQIVIGTDTVISLEADPVSSDPYWQDLVIFSVNETGEFLWAHTFGGDYYVGDFIHDIITDENDNIYIATSKRGTFYYDGEEVDVTRGDMIIKLNAQGELQWIHQLNYEPSAMSIDDAGNLYIAGFTSLETLQIEDNIINLDSDGGSSMNAVIVKYSSNMEYIWYNTAGAINYTYNAGVKIHDICVTESNEVAIAGYYSSSPGYDNANDYLFDTIGFSSEHNDFFMAFTDENGNFRKVITEFYVPAIKYLSDNLIAIACMVGYPGTFSNEITVFEEHPEGDATGVVLVFDIQTMEPIKKEYLYCSDEFSIIDLEVSGDTLVAVAGFFNDALYTERGTIYETTSIPRGFIARFGVNENSESLSKHGLTDWDNKIDISMARTSENIAITGRLDGTNNFYNQVLTSTGQGSDIVYGLFRPGLMNEYNLNIPESSLISNDIFYNKDFIFNPQNKKISRLRIFNLTGKLMYQALDTNASKIDVSFLPSGVFILAIETDTNAVSHSFFR